MENKRDKHVHIVMTSETRLALRLLCAANDFTYTKMVEKLILDAYNQQKFRLPKRKMSKIKRIMKKWSP